MLTELKNRVVSFERDEDGLGMLEMILIVAVIVVLAIIFRKSLSDLLTSLLGTAEQNTEEFMKVTDVSAGTKK
jgi:Flp pilus assembly pilin Flp